MTSLLCHLLSSTAHRRPRTGLTAAVVLFGLRAGGYPGGSQGNPGTVIGTAIGTAMTGGKPFSVILSAILGAVEIWLNSDRVIHSGRCRHRLAPT
jgi:hypothetical protein